MRRILPVFAAMLLVVLFGCDSGSGPAAPGLPSSQTPDLDDEYGGYSFTDEPPAFGEPDLFGQNVLAQDAPYEDEFENDPGVNEIARRPNCRTLILRIEWGRIMVPSVEVQGCRDFTVDWSGGLRVDRGAVLLKRIIQFEPEDTVHKRTDRRLLEWTSHTGAHFDGVLIKIIDAPNAPPDSSGTETQGPNRLVFRTGPYSRTFTLGELEHIDQVIPVDRCGNGISFEGFRVEHDPCPHGFLAGVWEPVPTDTIPPDSSYASAATAEDGREIRGHFYGNWIQINGMHAGHVRGVYGVNSEGRQVFFGKCIDFSGNFKGILKGRYGSMSMGPFRDTAGWFQGEWIDENDIFNGVLQGIWVAPNNTPRGFFHGRWASHCMREPGGGP